MMTHPDQRADCKYCTVPVNGGNTCMFCQSYVPPESPAQRLDGALNLVDLARHELNEVLRALPNDVGLFQALDLVTALGHLKQAVTLTEKVADQLDAVDLQAVTP